MRLPCIFIMRAGPWEIYKRGLRMLKDGAAGMWVWARFVPYSLSFLLAVAQLVSSCSGALMEWLKSTEVLWMGNEISANNMPSEGIPEELSSEVEMGSRRPCPKPMLSIAQQIDHMKSKGITFTLCSEGNPLLILLIEPISSSFMPIGHFSNVALGADATVSMWVSISAILSCSPRLTALFVMRCCPWRSMWSTFRE